MKTARASIAIAAFMALGITACSSQAPLSDSSQAQEIEQDTGLSSRIEAVLNSDSPTIDEVGSLIEEYEALPPNEQLEIPYEQVEALNKLYDELNGSGSEEVEGESRFTGTYPVTDSNGYTFNLSVDFRLWGLASDPSSQLPGETAITRNTSLQMTLENTTPQRELPFQAVNGITSPLSLPTFHVVAYYRAGNDACNFLGSAGVSLEGCGWTMAFARMESGLTVAPDSSYELKTWSGVPNGGEDSILLQKIPEADEARAIAALQSPDGYLIVYNGAQPERFPTLEGCQEPSMSYDPRVLVTTNGC